MSGNRSRAAMVEDVDEEGNVKADSQRYAKSVLASSSGSPMKQQMNTSRKKSSRRYEAASPSESDSTEHASSSSRHKVKEKRSSRSGKSKDLERPLIRTIKTTPPVSRHRHAEDPSYYGVAEQTIAASSTRPRALTTRPQSYYGPSHPPISSSAYYGGRPTPQHANPMSYPAPHWIGPPPGSSPLGTSPMANPGDYFNRGGPEGLASRFMRTDQRPDQRPRSSMGHRGASYGSTYDDYDAPPPPPPERQVHVRRQPSLSKRAAKESEDRAKMPPPARPSTTQPRQVFRPPPPQRKSVLFDEEDLDGESDMYHEVPRRTSIDFLKEKLPIRTRRQSLGPEYYEDQYALEPATSKSRRENRRSVSYSIEDKVKNASQYQNEVTGGAPQALTPENLRRHKNGGSSRSTRSSASRDESSFRQSATTRTTRSGSNDDDITIKVPSGAVVEVGNAKINCTRGGEINIGRGNNGSDRGTVYEEEHRSRPPKTERPLTRTRASSQSVHSRRPRALPSPYPNDPAHAPYPYPDYASPIPPYPSYPGTHFGGDDDDYYDNFR
ncbi:hypothetical protein AB5N19_13715 [Seiridium cardinale]|uniref:Uncharacterized protein n=1 Tax=Seiridium cardinale TaxID=138064 RepID=A0ABR2XKH7_9PEZI